MKECCGEVEKCTEKCCEGVLWRRSVKECCGEVLEKNVVEKF